MSMGYPWRAACSTWCGNAAVMVGIETVGAQGMEFDRSLMSSPLVEEQFAAIRRRVTFRSSTATLAPDIEAMRAWVRAGVSWPTLPPPAPSHQ